mmetsp:Transcript_41691/g.48647  ORF Transcript_41691/g.48647 Transcript_41691/m.48647 type:complete len:453 (+) Transcript_41691:65-1423(+)
MRVSNAFTVRCCVKKVTLLAMGVMLFVMNVRRATAFSVRSGYTYTTNARQRRSVKTTAFAILGDNLSHIAGESTDSKLSTGRKTRSFAPKQPKPSDGGNARESEKEGSKSNAFIDHYNAHHSGDWAGQSATFHALTSELVPIPTYYIPESLLEWGQAPSCLEVLTSESKIEETKLRGFIPASQLTWAESMETLLLERTEVRILPEVGCGLDNLDTLKTTEKLNLRWQNAGQEKINKPTKGAFMRNDTFAFLTEPLDVKKPLDSDRKLYTTFFPSPDQRIRISCTMGITTKDDATSPTLEIRTPVTMVVERKTSDESSGGTIADGGGLYASTVTELVGMDRINKPFSDKWGGTTGAAAIANDLWESELTSSSSADGKDYSGVKRTCVQTIHLPLGVTLRVFACPDATVSTVTKTSTTIVQTSWVSSDGDQRTVLETFVHPHGTPGWNYSTQTK